MKRIMILAFAMSIIPIFASADILCQPGKYKGKVWSVSQDINGDEASLEVKINNGKCEMSMNADGIREIWEIDGNTLYQREFNYLKEIAHNYKATLEDHKYIINCADRAQNKCDDGIDRRTYWTIMSLPGQIIYAVYGVGSQSKNDSHAVAVKRHEFSFRRNND